MLASHSCFCSFFTSHPYILSKYLQNVFIYLLLLLLLLIRCKSQTTQATELTQTRTQIAPPILQTSPIKEGTRHGTIQVSRDSDGSTRHRNSANDSK